MLMWKTIKAWALREPKVGPCYNKVPPKPVYVAKRHIKITKDMLFEARLDLIMNGRRRSVRSFYRASDRADYDCSHGSTRYNPMSVPMMVGVGIGAGLF